VQKIVEKPSPFNPQGTSTFNSLYFVHLVNEERTEQKKKKKKTRRYFKDRRRGEKCFTLLGTCNLPS